MKLIEKIALKNESYLTTTLKVSLFSILAILLADAIGFNYAPSAGIITILSIQATKKETLLTAVSRFLAFLCALLISYISFYLLGFSYQGFALYLTIFIFVCLKMNWRSAIALDSVLISHFLAEQSMSILDIGNELGLFLLGVGFGIFANIHLRNDRRAMEQLENSIDSEIKKSLNQMASYIVSEKLEKKNEGDLVLWDLLYQAESLARQNVNNQFRKASYYNLHYIQMRKEQAEVLVEMKKISCKINSKPKQAERISMLLQDIATEFHRDNTVKGLCQRFEDMTQILKQEELPSDREEFENRALLFALFQKIEEFLQIKLKFAEQYPINEKE